jgi:TPR repeat protein
MYDNGQGVEAADQGDADAQYNLGFRYANGEGVEQNYAKAVEYYQLAADQGHADAQSNLGAMYGNGAGVARSLPTALKWMKLAALQKTPTAQSALAELFFPPGTRVKIKGLKSNPSLNGSIGTVSKHLNPEQCSVTVDGHKKPMSVRYISLNLVM